MTDSAPVNGQGERAGELPVNGDQNAAPKVRGKRRMKELSGTYDSARAQLEADILSDLGREPSAIDRIAAETLAASVIRARRLRATGKSDADERKTVVQVIRATGLRPAPVQAAEPPNPYAMLFDTDDDEAADGEGNG